MAYQPIQAILLIRKRFVFLQAIIFSLLLSVNLYGQEVASYYFNNNLLEYTTKYPPLQVEGIIGNYVQEVVPKLGNKPRSVYQFQKNSGLNFNYSTINNFIRGSYAVEMYFRFDRADLLIYKQILGQSSTIKAADYVHLVTTRDISTKKVNVFLDGQLKMSFADTKDELAIEPNAQFIFFTKDDQETTSGAVAMIKIYNYFVDEEKAKILFEPFVKQNETPTVVTSNYTLKRLYFVQSEPVLLPESIPEMEKLLQFLKEKPTTKIALFGHTDDQGDFNLNLELSRNRAKAVKTFLLENGIAPQRIDTKGYGSTRPVASNKNETTRRLNRRVEMEVLNQ